MTDSPPQIDTQSILLDDAIGDEQLAAALVRVNAGELLWLAATLLSLGLPLEPEPAALARRMVVESLAEVVVHRDRIWEQPSLRAWLARLVRQRCLKREKRWRFRFFAPKAEPTRRSSIEDSLPTVFRAAWDKMGSYERITLLLYQGLGLPLAEIAWVFGSEPYSALYWEREGWRKIAHEVSRAQAPAGPLGAAPFVLKPAGPAPEEGGPALGAALRRFFPARSLAPQDLHSLAGEVAARVQAAHNRRRARIAARETLLVGLVLGVLFFSCRAAGLLPEELIHRYKTPTPTTTEASPGAPPTPEAPFYFTYGVGEGDTLETLAQKLGTTAEDIRSLNPGRFGARQGPLRPGDRIVLPAGPAMDWRVTVDPALAATPPPPLTAQTDLGMILERMENHRLTWRTLWASTREIYYGPPGYLGPPQGDLRRQIWLSQPGRARVVVHPSGDLSDYFSIFVLGGFNFLPDGDSIYGGYVGDPDDIPWYNLGMPAYAFLMNRYLGPVETGPLQENGLRVIREELHAGRRAVVLEGIVSSATRRVRLWVDAVTGVILRRLDYSAESPGVILRQLGMEAVVFDAGFPAEVFNPGDSSIKGFVQGPQATPITESQAPTPSPIWSESSDTGQQSVPAPPGFDPSSQPVFLRWPEGWDPAEKTATPGIQVLAGPYSLGSLPLDDVRFGGCRRSPDGRLIALRTLGDPGRAGSNQIDWFSLDAPQDLHGVCRDCDERPFAFSPDSRRLAYAGCRELTTPPGCSIYIHDLTAGSQVAWQISNDISEAYPVFLAWSPDSRFLAIVTMWVESSLKILDLQSGEIPYSGSYDPLTGAVQPDSPTREWGLALPPYDEIEMGCMEP